MYQMHCYDSFIDSIRWHRQKLSSCVFLSNAFIAALDNRILTKKYHQVHSFLFQEQVPSCIYFQVHFPGHHQSNNVSHLQKCWWAILAGHAWPKVNSKRCDHFFLILTPSVSNRTNIFCSLFMPFGMSPVPLEDEWTGEKLARDSTLPTTILVWNPLQKRMMKEPITCKEEEEEKHTWDRSVNYIIRTWQEKKILHRSFIVII